MVTDALPLDVRVEDGPGGALHVTLAGELDLQTGAHLRAAIGAGHAGRRTVRFDLSRLSFIDCAGLRTLLELQDEAEREGSAVEVERGVSRPVQRLLELTGRRALLHWSC
jgi:stage II sporulation protein AA (anti-sigma F factor antagonist)